MDIQDSVLYLRLFSSLSQGFRMSQEEYMFTETLADVRAKLVENTPYSLIRASGLLRQLLLDGTPLVHAVNREHKCKVEFEVGPKILDNSYEPDAMIHWMALRKLGPNDDTKPVKLDAFLKRKVVRYNSGWVTVRGIIKGCAHISGGVHLSAPSTDEEIAISNMGEWMFLGGNTGSMIALNDLCQVTLDGCRPLELAISGKD